MKNRRHSAISAAAIFISSIILSCFCGCADLSGLFDLSEQRVLFDYRDSTDGEISITAYIGSDKAVSIPDIIEGKRVTSIAEDAFAGTCVEAVGMGAFIVRIGARAFEGCSALSEIDLSGIDEIGSFAFSGCVSLKSADLKSSVTIGEGAFADCEGMVSVELCSSSDLMICENAFKGCTALENIAGGRSARYERCAFCDCTSLSELTFEPDAIIGAKAFSGCTSLGVVHFTGDTELPSYIDKFSSTIPSFPGWTTIELSEEYRQKYRRYIYEENGSGGLFGLFGAECTGASEQHNMSCYVDPCNGSEAIDITAHADTQGTVTWRFMNPFCEIPDQAPFAANGGYPAAGVNMTGATAIVFSAKGTTGNEKLTFFVGGTGYDSDGNVSAAYPDSTPRISKKFVLTDTWQQYTIDLSGAELSSLECGFGFVYSSTSQPSDIEFYLDDIYFEGSFA